MTSKEFEFYVKNDLKEYEGKYVAIVGQKVVASGDNAKEVMEEAWEKFPDKIPTLAKIPKEEALIFHHLPLISTVRFYRTLQNLPLEN